MRVLLVDDDSDFLNQARLFLRDEIREVSIETTTSPKKALKMLEVNDYDAIVSDYLMLEIDGLDFLEILREEKGIDIPFIFFTGKGREEVAMEALNLGADRYLRKGGDPLSQYSVLAEAITQEVNHWRAEKERERIEKRFGSFFQVAPDPAFLIKRNGVIEETNQAFQEKIGYEKDEIVGKKINNVPFLSEDSRNKMLKKFDKRMSGKEVTPYTLEFTTKDGGTRIVEINANVLKEDGDIYGEIVVARDITESKEKGRELQKEREMLNSALNASREIMFVKDLEGQYTNVNESFLRKFDYSREDIIGKTDYEIFPEEEAEKIRKDDERVIETGEPNRSLYGLTVNGEKRIFDARKTPIREGEEIIGICGFSRDNTQMLEIIPGPAHFINREGVLSGVNEAVCEITGYSRDEIIDNHLSDVPFILERTWEKLEKMYEEMIEKGKTTGPKELEIETKQGDIRVGEVRGIPLKANDGTPLGIIGITRDITEQKEAEQKVEKFSQLFHNLTDAVFVHSPEGNFLNVNDKAVERLGFSREELLSMGLQGIDEGKFEEMFGDRIEGIDKGESRVFESIHVAKDGNKIPVEVNLRKIDFEGKEAFVCVARDISERKKLEAEKLKKVVVGDVCRDIVGEINQKYDCNFSVIDLGIESLIRDLASLTVSPSPDELIGLLKKKIVRRLKREEIKVEDEEIQDILTPIIRDFFDDVVSISKNHYIDIPLSYEELKKKVSEGELTSVI